ncbi:MAG: DNA polymerase III subunit delta [Clostridia bacterium]|nr:DNA polymerase III subunit delta [Clostridia bacterium]
MSLEILKSQLKENKLANLYLFYGPEEYLKKYYTESIEKAVLKNDGLKALNKTVLEGKVETGRIIDACETMPVFSDKKLVVIKNSGLFKGRSKAASDEKKSGTKGDELVSYLQSVPEHACVVFLEEEIDKRMKAVDIVKKKGVMVEFAFQKPSELTKWVTKVFASHGKQIDALTASQLVEGCEQGMTEILAEIEKLVLYAGGRERITASDVEKVCTKSVKSRIFDLTDAIAEKDAIKAMKLLEDMIILKEPLPKILFMIARHFRHILEMKLLCGEGMSFEAAAARIGITPYAASKVYKHSKGFTVDRLKAAIEESLQCDMAIKSGRMKDRVAAELLITSLASGER